MSDTKSDDPAPVGYDEETEDDEIDPIVWEGLHRRLEELEAKIRHTQRLIDWNRGYTEDEKDVSNLVVAAQKLIVPALRWFEEELEEPPFLQLRSARKTAQSKAYRQDSVWHWSVYVVLLSRLSLEESGGHRRGRPTMPCVYVGQTWHPPEYRFQQHKGLEEGRASRYVRDWGLALLPQVYAPYNPLTREGAPEIEAVLADALHELGCTVFGGH